MWRPSRRRLPWHRWPDIADPTKYMQEVSGWRSEGSQAGPSPLVGFHWRDHNLQGLGCCLPCCELLVVSMDPTREWFIQKLSDKITKYKGKSKNMSWNIYLEGIVEDRLAERVLLKTTWHLARSWLDCSTLKRSRIAVSWQRNNFFSDKEIESEFGLANLLVNWRNWSSKKFKYNC